MRIDRVTYARMVNIGNYETERFEASGTVDATEDAHLALAALRAFVEAEITAAKLRREDERRREIASAVQQKAEQERVWREQKAVEDAERKAQLRAKHRPEQPSPAPGDAD